jgi:GTP-binding protein
VPDFIPLTLGTQVIVDEAAAGDIVTVAGFANCTVNHTLCAASGKPLPSIPVDPPTLAMTFGVNDSPFAGQEGSMLTSNLIAERLSRECDSNVSLQISRVAGGDSVEVSCMYGCACGSRVAGQGRAFYSLL